MSGRPASARPKGTMAEIVNLRRARKAKARAEAAAEADANRTKHGVSAKLHKLSRTRAEKDA